MNDHEMNHVTTSNKKLHAKLKLYVFWVAAGFLPHVMVPEGGGEAETPVGNLVDLFFANLLIE